uniref:J domain-containing protein n=1 Tax=Alexandrium monilatum TaxID=311494 RepID=A0A7S4Q5W9_9DINO
MTSSSSSPSCSTSSSTTALSVLGFRPNDTPSASELRRAYLVRAFACHPDRASRTGINAADATKRFQALQAAYEQLIEAGVDSQRIHAAPAAGAAATGAAGSASSCRAPPRASASQAAAGPEPPEEERAARDALRSTGLRHFVAALLAGPEEAWRRQLLYCGATAPLGKGAGGKHTRQLLWPRPLAVLEAVQAYIQDLVNGVATATEQSQSPTINKDALAQPGLVPSGIWKKGKRFLVQLRFGGLLVTWSGTDAGQSIMARMLIHSIISGVKQKVMACRTVDLDKLSRAVRDAILRAEGVDFEGWPLPLQYGCCIEVTKGKGRLTSTRVHSKYSVSVHRAMRVRRLQQVVLEARASPSTLKTYRRAVAELDRDLSEITVERLSRLWNLVAQLLAVHPRKRKAAESWDLQQVNRAVASRREDMSHPVAQLSLTERIERLERLHKDGALTLAQRNEAVRLELRAEQDRHCQVPEDGQERRLRKGRGGQDLACSRRQPEVQGRRV